MMVLFNLRTTICKLLLNKDPFQKTKELAGTLNVTDKNVYTTWERFMRKKNPLIN